MSLNDLIQTHAATEAAAGNWPAVADILNAISITIRDPRPVTYASLGRDFGDPARQLVAGTIRAAAKADTPQGGELADAHAVLLNEQVGMRIDSDARQAVIDGLAAAGGWPNALRDGIKQSRLQRVSPAGNGGFGVVTAEQCEAEIISGKLQQQWAAQLNETITPASNDRAALVAALRTAADAMEIG